MARSCPNAFDFDWTRRPPIIPRKSLSQARSPHRTGNSSSSESAKGGFHEEGVGAIAEHDSVRAANGIKSKSEGLSRCNGPGTGKRQGERERQKEDHPR